MKKNKLIVLGGYAGAGKTTIAKKLAANFNFPFFSSDEFNAGLCKFMQKDFFEVSPLAHDLTRHILKKNLEVGVTCVHDLNMCNEKMWEMHDKMTKDIVGIEVIVILLTCSLEKHKKRIEKRGAEDKEHLNLGGGKLEDSLHKFDFITSIERDDVIRVDANGSVDETYQKVLDVLNFKK